ncbi:MAG: anthranilate synthase component I family protein [Clostridiales Family XIII bacterium]|jgi:anthranilate synthase component 1|nr:anthranilate synthase component I family protein [Clostridiales Family XIII bacterium]
MGNENMDIRPSRAEAAKIGEGYRRVPVAGTMPTSGLTPAECFLKFKRLSKQCFILESLEDEADTGRYTFIGYDPITEITCKDGLVRIRGGADIEIKTNDPGAQIRSLIASNKAPAVAGLPPFTGGLVGYFAYDYIKYAEPVIELGEEDVEDFRDVDLMLFDKAVAFDRLEATISFIVNIRMDAFEENYNRALSEIESMRRIAMGGEKAEPGKLRLTSQWRPLFGHGKFAGMVRAAKRHIFEGDIFQAVLSNRLECDAEGSLYETYRRLSEINPSPYMFYFSSDDVEIAGAAPETLVKLRGDRLETFPLAGTRARGGTPAEDKALEAELLADPKELAEHNMLVDLGRNDIGRISKFGSVGVDQYMSIERFSHVMHIGSTVSGTIRDDKDAIDAIEALLPAGTLSGAPKIRACQIIGALEGKRRGIYGGAVGYIGLNGDMDTCIAIRIAYKKNGRVFIRSGAGIVADSVPENEYDECRRKLAAVVEALEGGGGRE